MATCPFRCFEKGVFHCNATPNHRVVSLSTCYEQCPVMNYLQENADHSLCGKLQVDVYFINGEVRITSFHCDEKGAIDATRYECIGCGAHQESEMMQMSN
jgi:hypothetical protein